MLLVAAAVFLGYRATRRPRVQAASTPTPPTEPVAALANKVFSAAEKTLLAANTTFRVSGFQFCAMLDNAHFDATAVVRGWRQSVAAANPDVAVFVGLVDDAAFAVASTLASNHAVSLAEAQRAACYLAAEGSGPLANISHTRLLVSIDPLTYFRNVLPNMHPQPHPAKRVFKMAYLLMIHELAGFPQVEALLNTLDDGDAIILIHVDARPKSQPLHTLITTWIHQRLLSTPTNIHLARHRFFNIWGHISLVFTQLGGFWELADMADWDFAINLSNYDYPIKSNAVMHEYLSRPQHRNKNWIQHWQDTGVHKLTQAIWQNASTGCTWACKTRPASRPLTTLGSSNLRIPAGNCSSTTNG